MAPSSSRSKLKDKSMKLHDYPIPDELRENVSMNKIPEILLQGLSEETYTHYFSTLLYLEDLHLEKKSKESMEKVKMRINKKSGLVILKVPGRSQGNGPSPLSRDYIHVKPSNKKGKEYKGSITRVKGDTVFAKFDNSFRANHHPNLEYEVRFSYNRINIKRGHQAIAAVGDRLSSSFLFPSEPSARKYVQKTDNVVPFNKSLNEEQLTAVRKILKCHGSPPYVIYGQHGTGTTETVTEAILQIHGKNPNARILACAPFNRASDSLLKSFIGTIPQSEMFRLNAKTRLLYDEVPPEILPYCSYEEEGFSCPPLEYLLEYKVIVSTYMSAARLYGEGVPMGHFTHIFLDKAGQGSEPETMVPIARLASTQTVVILSGNPRELAHEIRCPMTRQFGLKKSYLQRLIELPLYSLGEHGEENESFVTKLERQYDPHSEIWALVPSLQIGD